MEARVTDHEEREFALREADRMKILASQYRQLGFKELARHLDTNADRAREWAVRR